MTYDENYYGGRPAGTPYVGPSSPGYWTEPPEPGYPAPGSGAPSVPGPVGNSFGYQGYPPAAVAPSLQAAGYPRAYLPYGGYSPYGPTYPVGPRRPGTLTAAAVLAFVQSGFVLIGGLMTLSGASTMSAFSSAGWSPGHDFRDELAIVGIATIVAGGLLIVGGVRVLGGSAGPLTMACLLSIALSVYWGIRLAGRSGSPRPSVADFGLQVLLVYPVMFVILPIIAVSLARGGSAKSWAAFRSAGGR